MKDAQPGRRRKTTAGNALTISDRLIVAGEHLIGDFGTDAVSMRQVGLQAGTRNNYAVQYHFNDINGLIRAILLKRVPEIEERRELALHALGTEESAGTRTLLESFFRPLIALVDKDNEPRFARFMLSLHQSPTGWEPLDDLFYLMPATERILDLLQLANPAIPAPVIWQRLRPISVMVLSYTCNNMHAGLSSQLQGAIVDSLLDMAAAALSVPIRQSQVTKLYGFVY